MFESTIYIERRQKLVNTFPEKGLILLVGNEESPKNYKANTFHFRQDSTFLYYFGWSVPGLVALIDTEEGSVTLYGTDFTLDDIIWMGNQPTVQEMAIRVGVSQFGSIKDLTDLLIRAKFNKRTIHFLPPYRAVNTQKLARWLGVSTAQIEKNPSPALIQVIAAQRSIKSGEEIQELDKAVNISGAMHVLAMKTRKPGMRESELAGLVEGVAVGNGGDLAYPQIVTVNGQILHNHYHGNTLQSGQLVLIDAGAETERGYAGDITRTFPVDRSFTAQQKQIYNIVLAAEMAAIEVARPGQKNMDVHLKAAEVIAEGLKAIGLMKGDVKEAVELGAHALFFPHGIGHMIGLDVHDMEDLGEQYVGYSNEVQRSTQFGLNALRLGKRLEIGYAITIEPGIYFIPQLIEQWKAEKRFEAFINYDALRPYQNFGGVRIEDNILINLDGNRLLGEPIPKTVEAIEAL